MKKLHFWKRLGALFSAIALSFTILYIPTEAKNKKEVDQIIASIPKDWPEAPEISAETAVLMDADSGEILYAKEATKSMYPASVTKLATALLSLENASLDDVVEFSQTAVNIPPGSSHIGMRRGEKMLLKDCLYGLLLPSANEVANALAEHVCGSIPNFVTRMNERAYQLGAVNTSFVNANGLHDKAHYTCAYDLALILRACVANSTFLEIASTPSYVHHADALLNKDIPMTNTHMMIRPSSEYYNESVVCGKTGHTDESGFNLSTYAEKEGTRLIAVVMGCKDGNQYVSTQSLLDYGFNYFRKVLPSELDASLKIENAFTASPLAIPTPDVSLLSIDSTDSILLPDTVTFDKLKKVVEETEDGRLISYTYEGYPLGAISLKNRSEAQEDPIYESSGPVNITKPNVPNLLLFDGWMLISIGLLGLLVFLIIRITPKRNAGKKKKKRKRMYIK